MTATWAQRLLESVTPRQGGPGARKVLTTDSAHVVVFSFAAGQELAEHATHHAALIQCLTGRIAFTVEGETRDLHPGDVVHLSPQLPHAVRALEASVLQVVMLVTADPT